MGLSADYLGLWLWWSINKVLKIFITWVARPLENRTYQNWWKFAVDLWRQNQQYPGHSITLQYISSIDHLIWWSHLTLPFSLVSNEIEASWGQNGWRGTVKFRRSVDSSYSKRFRWVPKDFIHSYIPTTTNTIHASDCLTDISSSSPWFITLQRFITGQPDSRPFVFLRAKLCMQFSSEWTQHDGRLLIRSLFLFFFAVLKQLDMHTFVTILFFYTKVAIWPVFKDSAVFDVA